MTVKPLAKTPLGIQALRTGQADVLVGGNFPTMLEDDASGVLKVRILVEGYQGGPNVMDVLTLPDSHITDAAALAHRSVAVNLANGIQTLTLNRVLSAEGVNPATVDYKVIPFPAMAAALKNHQVDAIDVLEPFLTQAELSDGAFPVVDQLTGPTEALPISGTFTTECVRPPVPAHRRGVPAGHAEGAGPGRRQPRGSREGPADLYRDRNPGRRRPDQPRHVPHRAGPGAATAGR